MLQSSTMLSKSSQCLLNSSRLALAPVPLCANRARSSSRWAHTPLRQHPYNSQRCCSSRGEESTSSAEKGEKPAQANLPNGQDEEEPSEPEIITAVTLENATKAGLCALLCSLFSDWLQVDPWSAMRATETQDAMLGIGSSVFLAGLMTALLLIRPDSEISSIIDNPSREMAKEMEKIETKLENVVQINIDTNPFMDNAVPSGQPKTEAMTATPFTSGLRLFQLWFTKPFAEKTSAVLAASLVPSSSLFLAANEFLIRGLVAAVFAHWAQEAITNADSSSPLLWAKVLGVANEGTYRWIGVSVVAILSAWATSSSAEGAQSWARAVLRNGVLLADSERHGAQSTSESSAGVSGQEGGSTLSSTSASHSSGSEGRDKSSSSDSSSASSSGQPTEKDLKPGQAIAYNAATGEVNIVDAPPILSKMDDPTQEDEVVFNLFTAFGIAQVIQVNLLYGLTGNLLAPLAARIAMDLWGMAIARGSTWDVVEQKTS